MALNRFMLAGLIVAGAGLAVAECPSDLTVAECRDVLAVATNDLRCGRLERVVDATVCCLAQALPIEEELLAHTLAVEALTRGNDDEATDAAIDAWGAAVQAELDDCVLAVGPEINLFADLTPPPGAGAPDEDFGPQFAVDAARALAYADCFTYASSACRAELGRASQLYADGRWDEVPYALHLCVTVESDPDTRSDAYALLAMSYLALDLPDRAATAIRRLVFLARDYDPRADPVFAPAGPRLRDAFAAQVEQARHSSDDLATVLGIESCLGTLETCPDTSGACVAPPPTGRWEVGIQGGFFVPDSDLSSKSQGVDQIEPLVGLSVGYLLREHWGLYADLSYFDINTDLNADLVPARVEDAETLTLGLEAKRFFRKRSRSISRGEGAGGSTVSWRWLVSFGTGWAHYGLEFSPSVDAAFATCAFGQRWQLDRRAHLRWELGLERTLGADEFSGDLTTPQLLLNLTWVVGTGPAP